MTRYKDLIQRSVPPKFVAYQLSHLNWRLTWFRCAWSASFYNVPIHSQAVYAFTSRGNCEHMCFSNFWVCVRSLFSTLIVLGSINFCHMLQWNLLPGSGQKTIITGSQLAGSPSLSWSSFYGMWENCTHRAYLNPVYWYPDDHWPCKSSMLQPEKLLTPRSV